MNPPKILYLNTSCYNVLKKQSRYQAECALFEQKYNCTLEQFRQQLSVREQEDFAAEDDLLDWEYASVTLEWWNRRLESLRHVA